MNLDLSVASLVRASSGVLLAAFGLYLLTLRPATLRSRVLGVYHLALGPVFLLVNLFGSDLDTLALAYGASMPLYLAAAGALFVLVWRELRVDGRARVTFVTFFGLLYVVNLAVALLVAPGGWETAGGTPEARAAADAYDDGRIAYAVFWAAAPAAALAFAFRFRAITGARERRQIALLTAGLAVYPVFNNARALMMEGGERAHGWIGMASFALVALVWALAARGPGSTAARNTALAIVFFGLVGIGTIVLGDDYGLVGVSRLIGLAILAYAVFHFDLLGTGFTPREVQVGTVATGGLATLFIVAQVAQEFFAAEFGLLMGGIVAGTLLFAANPIQRAMERLVHGDGVGASTPVAQVLVGPPAAAAEREDAYRQAVRLALRDRSLTREEERQLFRLAHHLGLPTPRAMEINDEVERERLGRTA